jgi:hypothetical protein
VTAFAGVTAFVTAFALKTRFFRAKINQTENFISISIMSRKPNDTLSDEERLRLFFVRWLEMFHSRAFQSGLKFSYNIKGSPANGITYSLKEPDLEDFRSFLMVFRKFVSEKSPIFIPKIYNLVERLIPDAEFKAVFREARQIFNEVQQNSGCNISITTDGEILTQQYVIDMWMNGYYFHDDDEKIKTLERLESFQRDATKVIFTDYVIEISRIIQHLARNTCAAINRGVVQVSQPGKLRYELEILHKQYK